MKNYSKITENKDILTREYADSKYARLSTENNFTAKQTINSGIGTVSLKTQGYVEIGASYTPKKDIGGLFGFKDDGTGRIYAIVPRDLGFVERVKINGSDKDPNDSGTVDLGTVLTAHQNIKTLNTNNTTSQTVNASEAISGLGTINLHKVAKTGSYNDLLNKPTIPAAVTSINGLSGGTLTSPLTLTGGDSATASKIILSSNGQITDSSTSTMLGFSGGNYIVGSANYPTTFRGKQTRPTWNAKDLALHSDIPAAVTESTVSGWGFTKNTGTVTSVAVKMNGTTKGTVTSSGTIDLGTVLSEADVKGIKVNNAVYADSAGYVKNSMVYQGVGMNADANYSNFVTYNGSAARSLKFFKYDFQMQDALGSGDAELTLRNTGVTAGTYNSVTVDTKGRVTAGTNTPAVDTSNFAKLDAENTFTKGQVITGGTSGGYSIDASGYIRGSWLQASSTTNKGSNTGKVCVLDGNGWIYYRTPSEILSEASGVPKSAFSLSGTTLTITI